MNIRRRILSVLLATSFALVPLAPTGVRAQSGPARLSDVTVTSQPDAVTVLVKTSREPKYKAELIDGPTRLVVDFEDTQYAWRKTPLAVGMEPLKQVRGSQYRKGVSRLVFEFTRKTGYAIREDGDGLAIVIPAATTDAAGRVSRVAEIKAAAPAPAAAPQAPAGRPSAPEARRAPVQLAQAPAAAPPPPAPAMPSGPRLISFDFKDADVVNLLRILAAESTRNIVIGDDVKGKMSISLRNVPWELALDTVLETRGLRKIEKDGVLRIVSTEQLLKEREGQARVDEAKLKAENELRTKTAEAALKEQEAIDKKRASEAAVAELRARGPLREETIRLAYADPEEIARTLQGILGIPPEGTQAQIAPPPGGLLPTAEAPFASLYGPRQVGTPPSGPSADVLSKGITIRAHKPTNSIFIRHYEADLERIKKLVREKLDVPLPQVKIEARMEILDRVDLMAIGVQWGGGLVNPTDKGVLVGRGFTTTQATTAGMSPSLRTPAAGLANPNLTLTSALPASATTGLPSGGNLVNIPIGDVLGGIGSSITTGAGGLVFGIVGSRVNLNLALEALKTLRKTRTLARPEIVTVENYKATMSLGEEIPYATVSSAGTQVQFKEALLKLEVTPTVVIERDVTRIKMIVLIENNSRGSTVDFGTAGNPPAINKRKAETQVLVKEGERLVIGGVTSNVDDEFERKVPLFGDIPFLGWLFKSRAGGFTGRELVVFITPSVIKSEVAKAAGPKP